MKKINVSITRSHADYPIIVGSGVFDEINKIILENKYSNIHIVTDENVEKLYAAKLHDALSIESNVIVIGSSENNKSVATAEKVWKELLHEGADRKSLVINLGGGLVGDVGGFAASTFMRGVDFIQVPTTLLAAADASIGGKTGINFDGLKNMVGTFTQPKAVVIDTDVFASLDERLIAEGLAEIIKHGAIADADYFQWLEQQLPDIASENMTELLERSCQIKANIVQDDEQESDKRKLVNFGHTIGHAIESLSHKRDDHLLHGEAIAIGMVAEARLGETAVITEQGTSERLIKILKQVSLPTEIPDWVKQEDVLALIQKDKKNSSGNINWTLLERIGHAVQDQSVAQHLIETIF